MKEIIKKHIAIIAFALLYIVGFTVYYVSIGNYEFLLYIGVLVFFFLLIFLTLKRSKLPAYILWLLAIWGLLHMMGGGVVVAGDVLYKLPLWHIYGTGEWTIFKYDQVIHAYGFFTASLVVYELIKGYLAPNTNWKVILPVIALAGMGLGVVNEIVEFIAVITIPDTNVGGYVNTSLDLVFNAIGAGIAMCVINKRRKR